MTREKEHDHFAGLIHPTIPEFAETQPRLNDVRKYPCADCGVLRSKREGGNLFAVCDQCHDKHYAAHKAVFG